jgi:uncharacterized protein (DUF1697 family)
MPSFVAFLRAVNLPGKPVSMAQVRKMAEGLGFEEVRTLLQSGNLIFEAVSDDPGALEAMLEGAAKQALGLATDFMVRSGADIRALIDSNPYPDAARDDPGHLLTVFLKSAPPNGAVERLRPAIKGRETVELRGKELYAVYPDGVGRSKLTMQLIERHLGTRGTGRNWNTVLKLAEMMRSA